MTRIPLVPFLAVLLLAASSRLGAETEIPRAVYGKGFYDMESLKDKTWRWMDDEGTISLRDAKQDMILKIGGRVPSPDVMPNAPTIRVFFNGELLEPPFTAKNDKDKEIFEKEYKIPAAKLK